MEDKKFAVYNIDKDTVYAQIPYPLPTHEYLSTNGKYVIIEETPWTLPNYEDTHPGRISIFNGITGQLVQKLTLPPDGKVLVFDNYPNMLYYYLPVEQRSININLDSLAALNSSSKLNVKLISSSGTNLTTGTLQYYEGSWKNATSNGDGTFTVSTARPSVSLRMTYEYGMQQKDNVAIGSTPVVFQTVNAQVMLQNSLGNPIDTGTVQYYAGAWRTFGTTSNGTATKELLANNYSFRMAYAFGSNEKQQDLNSNPIVIFQTVNTAVQLKNSHGELMDQGTVQYYSGAWRAFGTTSNGVATKELLPNNYSFRMTYAYGSNDKQQNLSVNPTVVFQTVNVAVQLKNSQGNLIDQGTVQYYSGAWRAFGTTTNGAASKELLPNSYSFRLTHEFISNDKQQDIGANNIVMFSTVSATVKVTNLQNNPVNNAAVTYYSGAWRTLGTTAVNGEAIKELLPANLPFRAKFGTAQQDKTQNLTSNPVVEIQLNINP